MLQINQLKLKINHTQKDLERKICDTLRIQTSDLKDITIQRQSIDARRKPDIYYIYTVMCTVNQEDKILKKLHKNPNVQKTVPVKYTFPSLPKPDKVEPVVIAGMGPAGLFCAYFLLKAGYPVLLLERGKCVEERTKDVSKYWETGVLDTGSNVQFGEGGAGTFSDGKLNTLVKDKDGRNGAVLETFVHFGADPKICYEAKPHIGTDVLTAVVKNMREEIIRLGGIVRFESQVTDFKVMGNRLTEVTVNGSDRISCKHLVLAIGHSARDTFELLYNKGCQMEAKSFAVGFRVEHPQSLINLSQYGMEDNAILKAAPYKVTAKTTTGRGVYSFCMCPGGYVVNASSEKGRIAVNGMSYSRRDSRNANSAIIVAVTPSDFGSEHALAGVEFQRRLEAKAYELGQGKIPVQRYGDYRQLVCSDQFDDSDVEEAFSTDFLPCLKGQFTWADVTQILPEECNRAFVEGMEAFGHMIHGFNCPNAILSGVESRTSSPVRINRDDTLQSNILGIFPCGEGAGYAGGITSAAMDGIRVAEAVALELSKEV